MAKNELIVAENFDLITITGELEEIIAEEMDGLGNIPFEKVKIPSGGGLAFELPGEDEDDVITSQEIQGVILVHHPINAYWENKYNGSNDQPDCSSYDGKQGVDKNTGELKSCATCPYNQFGSDGQGKACKNIHRCYIQQEGNPVPIILSLPPTSLKYLRNYIGKKILLNGMRCYDCVTKITLKKEKSKDGITYSRVAFNLVGKLSEQQRKEAKKMADTIKEMTKNIPVIDDSDYNVQSPLKNSDFMNVEDTVSDEGLPFN